MDKNEFSNLKSGDNQIEKREKIKVEWASETTPSEKHPERNEDAILTSQEYRTFGVFDGVGGGFGGDIASKTARDYVLEHLNEMPDATDIEVAKQAFMKIILGANNAVYEASKANHEYLSMHTTATILKIHTDNNDKHYVLVANIGDSRAYKISNDGNFKQITEDDDKVSENFPFDKNKRMEIRQKIANIRSKEDLESDSEISNFFRMRGTITKALGTQDVDSLIIDLLPVEKGDRFVITSDGIHDNLTSDEILETLKHNETQKEIAEKIMEKSLIRSREAKEKEPRAKPDDMSVVLFDIK